MATFYIDPSQGSNGTGTLNSPYNTWTGITPTPGNTYLQKRGTTWTAPSPVQGRTTATMVFFFNNNGTTSSNFMTFGSYYNTSTGEDDTTKPRPILDMNYSDMGFRFHDSPYNVVQNLEILHCGHSSIYCSTANAQPTDPGYTKILNCVIRDNRPQANYIDVPIQSITVGNPTVLTFAAPGHNLYNRLVGIVGHTGTITASIANGAQYTCTVTSATTMTVPVDTTGKTVTNPGYLTVESNGLYPWSGRGHLIDGCEIYNLASDGIWGQSEAITIRNTYIHDIALSDQGGGDCLQLNGPCSNFLVENCILDHSKRFCKQGFILSSASSGYGGVFRNNIIYDPDCSGTPIGISNPNGYGSFYCDQPGVVVRNNTIIGGGKFMLTAWGNNQVFEGNKLYVTIPNSCWYAMYAPSTTSGSRFTGNLVYIAADFHPSGGTAFMIDSSYVKASNNYIVCTVTLTGNKVGINMFNSPRPGNVVTNNVIVGFPIGLLKRPAENPIDKSNWIYNCTSPVTDHTYALQTPDPTTILTQPVFNTDGQLITTNVGTFSVYGSDSSVRAFISPTAIGPSTQPSDRAVRTIINDRTIL